MTAPDAADDVRYVSTKKPKPKPEKKKTPNVNVTAYFLIQRHHASLLAERASGRGCPLPLLSLIGEWNGEGRDRQTEVVMSG